MTIKPLIGLLIVLFGCGSDIKKEMQKQASFSLDDFYAENTELDRKVEAAFSSLDEKGRIAQMIVVSAGKTGKPTSTVDKLIKKECRWRRTYVEWRKTTIDLTCSSLRQFIR